MQSYTTLLSAWSSFSQQLLQRWSRSGSNRPQHFWFRLVKAFTVSLSSMGAKKQLSSIVVSLLFVNIFSHPIFRGFWVNFLVPRSTWKKWVLNGWKLLPRKVLLASTQVSLSQWFRRNTECAKTRCYLRFYGVIEQRIITKQKNE